MEQAAAKKKLRSPNCPGISLPDALTRARKIYDVEHTHQADREVIAKDLGYGGMSGASATIIGALKQYGILEPAGDGMRISDDAVTAFELPDGSPEKIESLRRMAFKPEVFEDLRTQFPDRPPGEANMRHILIKRGFLPKPADEAIQAYLENFALVGSNNSGYNRDQEIHNVDIGSYVQWEAQGVLQFKQPRRVRSISDDGEWAFVEGSSTGIPIGELTVIPTTAQVETPSKELAKKAAKSFMDAQEISLPVGMSDSGDVIFAHVRFDGGIKKNLLTNLRALLEAMEKPLPD
jgi:hypothetical protein